MAPDKMQTLCHIIDGNRILLKRANRGISKGKWNAPGGNIDEGESAEECAMREVLEETGLRVRNLFCHGTIVFHFGENDPRVVVPLFSTKDFDGSIIPSEEGDVRWFDFDELPLGDMWDDDNYWLDLMIRRRRFDADFYFGEDKKVARYSVVIK
jgi:8-oxo-dGTP diphosphatase